MNHSHEGFIRVEEQRGTWQGITTTQKDLGLKKSREFGCSVLRSALWEGLKPVEITAAPPAQERGFNSTPRFSLLGNEGKLGMGFPGAGNTQPGPTKAQELIPQPLPALQDSLAGEEGDPGEAKVVGVHEDVLHEEVWGAAVL